ncbi:MAG: class I SAM-dependent methyltransferase [Patescibacteria group bacterium]
MHIFQIDRMLLDQHIKEHASHIVGAVLDVGAGSVARYRHYFTFDSYIRMDIQKEDGIDVVGSAERIPFPDTSFDGIVCTQVLEHVVHPEQAMREMSRVLRPGGTMLLTVPQACELHEEPYDFSRFTKYWIESIARECGLTVARVVPRGGMFSMMTQFCIRYLIDRGGLYRHRMIGAIASRCFSVVGRCAIFLDRIDTSTANKKHTMGWLAILKK